MVREGRRDGKGRLSFLWVGALGYMKIIVLMKRRSEDDGEDLPLASRHIDIDIKQGNKVVVCGRIGRLVGFECTT
jgi:hypothetical protein